MGKYILMPKMGMTMTEGQIIKWLVKEGQKVDVGDNIFEVETDKTALEVDSLYSGTIRKLYYDAPATVKVNAPVAFIGDSEEEVPDLAQANEEARQMTDDDDASHVVNTPEKAAEPAVPQEKPAVPAAEPDQAYDYDLVVVGAGPGGYVAAIRAAQLGAKTAVIEKDNYGGTCLNRGCIPTKALHHSAMEWTLIKNAGEHGFKVGTAAFDWDTLVSRKDGVVAQLTGGVKGLLKKNGVALITGSASISRAHEVSVNGETLSARYILLATGSKPLAKITAETALPHSDEILSIRTLPKDMVIIGGGVIGCEIAHIFGAFGVDVTVVEFMPRILPMVDAELSDTLAQRMKADGIKIMTGTKIEKVLSRSGGYEVVIENGDPLQAELVLEAVGRCADLSAVENAGVSLTKNGYVKVDARYATSVEGVYAVGDCNGISQLAHSASHQGIQVAEALFGQTETEAQPVPACIFSSLEIATVGKTLEEAKNAGLDTVEFKFPYAANGKAVSMNAREGFAKVVVDRQYGEIVGVHIIGEQASTMIHEAVMAMRGEMTAYEAGHTIHVHPTLSEIMMEAFLGSSSGAIHI